MTRIISAFLCLFVLTSCNKNNMKYKDPSLPIEMRVDDLLSRMTLEEKAAQMVCVNEEVKDLIIFEDDGSINIERIKDILPQGIGQIARLSETKGGMSQTSDKGSHGMTPAENAALTNAIQSYFMEETRLGIPAIFHEECLHGLVASYATSTPQPIAMAGTFHPELVEEVYAAVAKETRLRGTHQALTPVVDVARDPRWGRVEETFGEDPYLVAQMGCAVVRGFQGDASYKDKDKIIANLKHFAAHGQPEGGTNTAPANYSERILREVHFYPFKEAIQKAGALSVMTTYHEIDGVPINANKWLVRDILRKEWGFEGFVVSDYYSIREMHDRGGINAHRVARDGKHAAELALKAGVNIELPNPDCYKHIIELVNEGTIAEKIINELVAELLRAKFMMGLFDNPYVDPAQATAYCGTEERRPLAKQAALEAITLLENKEHTLPLDKNKLKHIAVIGPNANRVLMGGYSGTPSFYSTPLEGIKDFAGNDVKISYAEGCKITIGGSWVEDKVTLPDPEEDRKLITAAVKLAKTADVVILALGGNEQTSREAWSNTHLGDRASLELMGMQNELLDALSETGKPIVTLLFNGRPLAISNVKEKSDALLECWYLGQEAGHAVADVLFGEYNPGGKLPISFPRSAGHIPIYYNHKPSARRGYFQDDITPLYAFGYGLSYTSFEISDIRLSKELIGAGDQVELGVNIKNIGKYRGDEVLQLFIRDDVSSVTRPVKELKDFKRVSLEPGEQKSIQFIISSDKLSFYDINMNYLVEPGEFTLYLGTSSRDEDLQTITLRVE